MGDDPVDRPGGLAGQEAPPGPLAAPPLDSPADAALAEQLERRVRLAEDRLAEVLAAYRQIRVENEGYRDRVARDVERQYDRRRERLVLKFIEILDNLDRALEAAEQTYAGNPLIEGLILVRTQLLQALQQEGLERIPVLGLPYDPGVSEAVGTQAVSDPEHDHVVVRELMRGYRLRGRVARASRVLLGTYDSSAVAMPVEDRIGADETADSAVEPTAAADDDAPVSGSDAEDAPAASEPGVEALDAALDETTIDESALREIFGEPPKRGD